MDLQNNPDLQQLNVAVVSIALDPADQQAAVKQEYGITAPMLVDAQKQVSSAYDVLRWAVGTGEPGHTFILVDTSGQIAWIRDYGSPSLPNPTMYVEPSELVQQIKAALNG